MIAQNREPMSPAETASAPDEQRSHTMLHLSTGHHAWTVTIQRSGADRLLQAQWYLLYQPGAFPFSVGTYLSYDGMLYELLSVGSASLTVTPLPQEDGVVLDAAPTLLKRPGKQGKWARRAQPFKPICTLSTMKSRTSTRATHRRHDDGTITLITRFCYEINALALPDSLSQRFPPGMRRCYIEEFEIQADQADEDEHLTPVRVAATPQELATIRPVNLNMHDTAIVAALLREAQEHPIALQRDIRMLPVYALPKAIRAQIRTRLFFVLPNTGPFSPKHVNARAEERPENACEEEDEAQLPENQPLSDYVYLAPTDETHEGKRRVEIAVLVDRLLGTCSRQAMTNGVFSVWMDQDDIDKALCWDHSFEQHESFVRRSQVALHLLAMGEPGPTQEDVNEALVPARRDEQDEDEMDEGDEHDAWDQDEEKPLDDLTATTNIFLPKQEVLQLLYRTKMSGKEALDALLALAITQVKQRALHVGKKAHAQETPSETQWEAQWEAFQEVLQQTRRWCSRQGTTSRVLGLSSVTEQEEVEREAAFHVNPRGNSCSFRNVPNKKRTWQRERWMEPIERLTGFHLVVGVPSVLACALPASLVQQPRPERPSTPKVTWGPPPKRLAWPKKPNETRKRYMPIRRRADAVTVMPLAHTA